jgi:hyperosmotically inducible periplasmic protein
MFRAIFRLLLLLVIVAAVAAFFLGYRLGGDGIEAPVSARQPTPSIDTDKARQTGAAIGEKVATGAAQAEQALGDAALTAKIKSKMALDDTVKALSIDVDTSGGVVTVSGIVSSQLERSRAVQLAQETVGVKTVYDHLIIK